MAYLDFDGLSTYDGLIKAEIGGKQDALVSGTNIKTVNNISLLGSGNVSISDKNDTAYKIKRGNYCYKSLDSSGSRRLLLTSADGTALVPINTSTSSSSTAAKTLNTRPIDPFGAIYYYDGTPMANGTLIPSSLWTQYDGVFIGYSYVVTLTSYGPVYLKCSPNADGSAVMLDIVTALPTSNDGFIYIYLGNAYSTSAMELAPNHPVYYHDGTGIRLWAGAEPSGGGGANKLTFYTDTSYTNLWIDKALTVTLLEHYGYDLSAAKTAFQNSDFINVMDYYLQSHAVLFWEIDTADEDFYVTVMDSSNHGKLVGASREYDFATVKTISVS